MARRAPAVGIDLGTTNSCVAVYQDDTVKIITNEHGFKTTPSYVSFLEDKRLIGEEAKSQQPVNPSQTIFDGKRLIGRNFDDPLVQRDIKTWPFRVVEDNGRPKIKVKFQGREKTFVPEEISAMVLQKLKDNAETFMGLEVRDAVITVPAYFNDSQRQATRDAGRIAGLNVLRVLSEPTAAAVAYGLDKVGKGSKNILVFDLGGGTFDVSVLSIDDGIFDVKATNGDTHLGGEDFDSRLVEYCMAEFKKKHRTDLRSDQNAIGRIRAEVEKVKRTLSQASSANIEIELLAGVDFHLKIKREKFEQLNEDLFKKTLECVETALKYAAMRKEDIDEIVMVGGSSRIPKIQSMVQEYFGGKRLCKTIHPDEAVANGASIVASLLSGSGGGKVQDIVLHDVIPLSLGVEIQGSLMSVLIKRNTTVPTTAQDTYTTMYDQQTEVSFKVFEGERSITKKNILLGEFLLTGVPPMAPGKPKILVTFEVDEDAILHANAVLKGSGSVKSGITIENNKGRLGDEELNRMVLEAQEFQVTDEIERKRIAAKNKLQTLMYNLQSFIKRGKLQVPDREAVLRKCQVVSEWINQNENVDQRLYEDKLGQLEDVCDISDVDSEEVISGRLQYKPTL